MIGVVEVFYGGNKIASEPNMIMDNLGEIIADFMSKRVSWWAMGLTMMKNIGICRISMS